MRLSSLRAALIVLTLLSSIRTTATQEWKALISDAGSLAAHDHRDSAVILAQRAYDNGEVLLGANPPVTIAILLNLGLFSQLAGRYSITASFGANCPESETPCR